MQFTGSATFHAPRADVWALLTDPTRLEPCLPIRIPIIDAGDGNYRAEGRVGSGWLSTMLRADITLMDIQPERGVRIVAHGGASGTTFDGTVTFTLRDGPPDGPVDVDWSADLQFAGAFGGQVARVVEQRGADELEQLIRCMRSGVEV